MLAIHLTSREREVVLLAADGLTDKQIAERLGVGRGTVATYWARMRERNGAANRAQAIALEMARVFRESEAERAHTEGLFAAMVENLEDYAVFLLDERRIVMTWNPGVYRVLGYREEEWIGQVADVIFTPEERAAGAPDGEQATAMRKGRALDDRWHLCKDGTRFWASGILVAVRSDAGELLCFAKLLRDLTRLKRLEERIAELGGDPESV